MTNQEILDLVQQLIGLKSSGIKICNELIDHARKRQDEELLNIVKKLLNELSK